METLGMKKEDSSVDMEFPTDLVNRSSNRITQDKITEGSHIKKTIKGGGAPQSASNVKRN